MRLPVAGPTATLRMGLVYNAVYCEDVEQAARMESRLMPARAAVRFRSTRPVTMNHSTLIDHVQQERPDHFRHAGQHVHTQLGTCAASNTAGDAGRSRKNATYLHKSAPKFTHRTNTPRPPSTWTCSSSRRPAGFRTADADKSHLKAPCTLTRVE